MLTLRFASVLAAAALVAGCTHAPDLAPSVPAPSPVSSAVAGALRVRSPAFADGATIPRRYTCDGEGLSPPIEWDAIAGARSYALIVHDPDAPGGRFVHWVLFDIPASRTALPEGGSAGRAGTNSAGAARWTPPCPPSGTHRYVFTIYALDLDSLGLSAGRPADEVIARMGGHVLASGWLTGRYGR